jgi:hypothetical protein
MPLSVTAPGVLDNDTDDDSDALSATLETDPPTGSLVFNPDGSFVYTPPSDFQGEVQFIYQVTDGLGGSDQAEVSIHVGDYLLRLPVVFGN